MSDAFSGDRRRPKSMRSRRAQPVARLPSLASRRVAAATRQGKQRADDEHNGEESVIPDPWLTQEGAADDDGDIVMRSQRYATSDSLGDEDDDDERLIIDEGDSDSADEYRPEPIHKTASRSRGASTRRDEDEAYATSSGEEFEPSEADDDEDDEEDDEWESDEGVGTANGNSANQLDASQQAATTESQRLDRARKSKWRPPHVGHGGLEGLATWRQMGTLHRSRRAANGEDDDAEVEVEDGEIRTLADAFANVASNGDALPEAQIKEWQRALHADDDVDEEMDETAFENDMRAAAGFRRKKGVRSDEVTHGKRRRAPREQTLSSEVRQLMTQANVAYVNSDLMIAVDRLQEVIRIEPAVRPAWATLAVCFGEMEQTERALQCQIMAAHLTSHPLRLWVDLAEQSKDLNYNEQALYCLSKAITSSEEKDRSDVLDIMWERGQMLIDMGDKRRAVKNFLRMLHYRPQNQDIIRKVVPLLYELEMLSKAVDVLEQCADWNMRAFPDPLVDPAMLDVRVNPDVRNTYESSEVVTLADLLLTLNRPHEALNTVRRGARWLQGRGSETFWDDIQADDREFDLERSASRPGDYGRRVNLAPVHDLDVAFRFRLAKARAQMDNVYEARHHFGIWRSTVDTLDHSIDYGHLVDAYLQMASRLIDDNGEGDGNDDEGEDDDERQDQDERKQLRTELYTEGRDIALELILEAQSNDDLDDGYDDDNNEALDELLRNYRRVARCYTGLGDYAQAQLYLREVIQSDASDLESKLHMAEVLEEMGQREEAIALVAEVVQAKRLLRTQDEHDEHMGHAAEETLPQSLSLFVEMTERGGGSGVGISTSSRASRRGSREQLVQLEALREAEALATRRKIKARESEVFVDRWWHPDVPMAGNASQRVYGSRESYEERQQRFEHVAEWLADMEGLITMFCNTSQLFLKDKTKRFSGMFRRTRRRGGGDAVDRQARAMLSRMRDDFMDEDTILRNVEHSMFRGITLNEWVDMFMQYSFVLTKIGDFSGAREVIHRVMRSNVVWNDDERRLSLNLCLASCALYAGRFSTAMSEAALRSLAFTYQFHTEALRALLVIGNAGGYYANRALASTNNLKFFLRRSRIHEALVQDTKSAFNVSKSRWVVRDRMFESSNFIGDDVNDDDDDNDDEDEPRRRIDETSDESSDAASPAASTTMTGKTSKVTGGAIATKRKHATDTGTARKIWSEISHLSSIDHVKAKPPTKYNPANDMFYAGLLLTSSNGTPSMAYWLRIYERQRSDALVCLACAVACLGRASNRQVDNRHQVVTQAYASLHFYRKIRRRDRQRQRRLLSGVAPKPDDDQEEDEAEVHYNFGRAAQHLGLYQLAVPHYLAVLKGHRGKTSASSFDCVVESAFSLHLIYIASGNPRLANAIMEQYLRV